MKTLSTLLSAALLLAANAASATTVVASDNFQSAALGAAAGQNSGSGWASSWQSGLAGAGKPMIVAQGPVAGNQAMQIGGNDANAATRVMSTSLSGDVFIDFQFQYSGNVLGDNDFLGLWFGNYNGPNIGLKANCGGDVALCTNDAFVRTTGTGGPYLPVNMQQNVAYHLFGHLYKTGASTAYNKFDAWIDPTAMEMSTLTGADATASGFSGVSSFNTIGFRTVNLDHNVVVRVDDLKVSVVPEPGSIALFGLALAGMVSLRRAKRS